MSASRQLNNLESKANVMRLAGSIRRGRTLRSLYSASCRRRKRFSAAIASRPDEQTEIDDEISDQLKEDAGSSHDVAIMPQIPSGFGQNRGILFLRRTRYGTRSITAPLLPNTQARHVVKHLTQDSKVIVAVADELLHLGIDHRGNLELFPGEIHGWTYIGSGQTQLQPLRKFSSSSVRLPSVPATPTWASSAV